MIDLKTCFTYAYSAGTSADFFQAITSDAASTNIIDLDTAGISIAGARPPWVVVRVGTVFATLTSLEILLETDSDSAFGTTLKQVAKWELAAATMTAGALIVNQPIGNWDYQRYMRLKFNSVGSTGTGSVVAYLQDGPETAVTDIDQVTL
jgi:hypothetical protein